MKLRLWKASGSDEWSIMGVIMLALVLAGFGWIVLQAYSDPSPYPYDPYDDTRATQADL